MALDPKAVGRTNEAQTFTYTWKDTVLYALGVGAKTEGELDFVFEANGPKVLPTFAVVPALAPSSGLLGTLGGNFMGVVHGAQGIKLHKPFAAEGTLKTMARVVGVYDLKRMAQAIVATETRDAAGDLICETEWTIIYRMDGGFGGEPPPKREDPKPPARPADWMHEEFIGRDQAALYRLSGDLNPLHVDPKISEAVGFGRPILHGLCTYGIVGRAVLKNECGGDVNRFKSLSGQFRKPVWPGDTLVVEGWKEDGRVLTRASRKEAPGEYVFSSGVSDVT